MSDIAANNLYRSVALQKRIISHNHTIQTQSTFNQFNTIRPTTNAQAANNHCDSWRNMIQLRALRQDNESWALPQPTLELPNPTSYVLNHSTWKRIKFPALQVLYISFHKMFQYFLIRSHIIRTCKPHTINQLTHYSKTSCFQLPITTFKQKQSTYSATINASQQDYVLKSGFILWYWCK
jgi:hypothetical protein